MSDNGDEKALATYNNKLNRGPSAVDCDDDNNNNSNSNSVGTGTSNGKGDRVGKGNGGGTCCSNNNKATKHTREGGPGWVGARVEAYGGGIRPQSALN